MNDFEKKLINALRSGLYKQERGVLKREGRFCCLGVACDISGVGHWVTRESDMADLYVSPEGEKYMPECGDGFLLPTSVKSLLKWASYEGILDVQSREGKVSLTMLNDAGFTFDQIADIIEAGLIRKDP